MKNADAAATVAGTKDLDTTADTGTDTAAAMGTAAEVASAVAGANAAGSPRRTRQPMRLATCLKDASSWVCAEPK